MKRRVITGVVSVVLAILGVAVVLAYAHGADTRAMAGVQSVSVFVVKSPIPKGTAAAAVPGFVRLESVPAKVAAVGSMGTLAQIAGNVAIVDLQPGEQLLASRFGAAESLQAPGSVAVPKGMQQVTVKLAAERALGGQLSAGDHVGVFISLPGTSPDTSSTHLTLQKVLVTRIEGGVLGAGADRAPAIASSAAATPVATVLVTLAVTAPAAEQLVYGTEHGTLWLSDEPSEADPAGTRVITGNRVFK